MGYLDKVSHSLSNTNSSKELLDLLSDKINTLTTLVGTLTKSGNSTPKTTPKIFMNSPTVLPGEAFHVSGYFSKLARVCIKIPNSDKVLACTPLQEDRVENTVHVLFPKELPLDNYFIFIQDGEYTSNITSINKAEIYHADWSDITPNCTTKIIGRNLYSREHKPAVQLVSTAGVKYPASILYDGIREEVVSFKIPANLPVGDTYSILYNNGLANSQDIETDFRLECLASVFTYFGLPDKVVARHKKLAVVKSVDDKMFSKNPVGNGIVDDSLALNTCLRELSAKGGGVLDGGGKTYKVLADPAMNSICINIDSLSNVYLYNCTINYGYGVPPTQAGYGIFIFSDNCGLLKVKFNNVNEKGNYGANFVVYGDRKDILLVDVVGNITGEAVVFGGGITTRLYMSNTTITSTFSPANANPGGALLIDMANGIMIKDSTLNHQVGYFAIQGGKNVVIDNLTQVRDASVNNRLVNPASIDTRNFSANFVTNLAILGLTSSTINGPSKDLNDGETFLTEGGGPLRPNTDFGKVTSSTSTILTDSNAKFGSKKPVTSDAVVLITYGKGMGQWRNVLSSTSTTLTVDKAWEIIPDTTSVYSLTNWSLRNSTLLDIKGTNNRSGISLFAATCLNVLIKNAILVNNHSISLRPYQVTNSTEHYINPIWNSQVVGCVVKRKNTIYKGVPSYIGVNSVIADPAGSGIKPQGALTIGVEIKDCSIESEIGYVAIIGDSGEAAYNDYRQREGFLSISDNQFIDDQLGYGANGEVPITFGVLFDSNNTSNCQYAYSVDNSSFGTTINKPEIYNCSTLYIDEARGASTHVSRATNISI